MKKLLDLIETLRGENGCPWDKKQTPDSITLYLTEELHELMDAIASGSPDEVCEELGDVLFHIIFITRLFQEKGEFNIADVIEGCVNKMTRRHPHVFGGIKIDTPDEVKSQWHQIKLQEKNHAKEESVIDSVPARLPVLMRAYRISERVAQTGFDWENITQVIRKIEEELAEFKTALTAQPLDNKQHQVASRELGDIFLALVNLARFVSIQPESALAASLDTFCNRFKTVEKTAARQGRSIRSLAPVEMETLWQAAKKENR